MTNPAVSQIPDDVRLNQTYAHRLARVFVRPLIGTCVRPNHLTWSRLVVGVSSCAFLSEGSVAGGVYSGLLWFICCLLDRADGELARMGNMRSESGRVLDFYSDLILDSLWFLAAGFGARHGGLGAIAIILGVVTCGAMFVCNWLAERYEKLSGPGVKTYYGIQQFHPDDGLFLLPLFVWAKLLTPLLIAASTTTVVMAIIISVRYQRLLVAKRQQNS